MEYIMRHLYFLDTHEPLGECVYNENTCGVLHGIPRESIA